MIPIDDALIDGPEGGLRNPTRKLGEIIAGAPDAILGFRGVFKHSYGYLSQTAGIMNLTASSVRATHTRKILVGKVEEALYWGLDGVAVHVNVTSQYESEMLSTLGTVARECEVVGMPLMALMYPRSETPTGDNNYLDIKKSNPPEYARLVRHAARIGVELGADIIKTQYTGDPDSFGTVVEACGETPVVIAGGPFVELDTSLLCAKGAIQAGAAGVCFGRNSFNREDTTRFVKLLRGIVHGGDHVDVSDSHRN